MSTNPHVHSIVTPLRTHFLGHFRALELHKRGKFKLRDESGALELHKLEKVTP